MVVLALTWLDRSVEARRTAHGVVVAAQTNRIVETAAWPGALGSDVVTDKISVSPPRRVSSRHPDRPTAALPFHLPLAAELCNDLYGLVSADSVSAFPMMT